jgi:hypothetical protein
MHIYYAHCMALYNTVQEQRDLLLLDSLFPTGLIVNPNSPSISVRVNSLRGLVEDWNLKHPDQTPRDPGTETMEVIFRPLVQLQDVLVFRALPDGTIPAGVAKEITWAEEANLPILELPSAILRRTLTLPQTKQYLREVGQR